MLASVSRVTCRSALTYPPVIQDMGKTQRESLVRLVDFSLASATDDSFHARRAIQRRCINRAVRAAHYGEGGAVVCCKAATDAKGTP